MDIRVVYFDGCPSQRTAKKRLGEALARIGRGDTPVRLTQVETEADARAARFAGSPTVDDLVSALEERGTS